MMLTEQIGCGRVAGRYTFITRPPRWSRIPSALAASMGRDQLITEVPKKDGR